MAPTFNGSCPKIDIYRPPPSSAGPREINSEATQQASPMQSTRAHSRHGSLTGSANAAAITNSNPARMSKIKASIKNPFSFVKHCQDEIDQQARHYAERHGAAHPLCYGQF